MNRPVSSIGLGQRAAAVVAQVHHHAFDTGGLQLAEQLGHVARRALEVLVAFAARTEIGIEGRQVDHADLAADIAVLDLDDLLLGGLLFDAHLLAHQGDQLVLAVHARIGRQDLQPHGGVLLATDVLDHIVQAPADHVDHRAAGAFADRQDAIAHLHLAGLGGRAGGHDFTDRRVLVARLQHRADAFQRQLHGDVEILRRTRAEVVGVRIGGFGVGVHEGLERVFAIELLHAIDVAGIALVQRLADVIVGLAGQLQAQPVVHGALDATACPARPGPSASRPSCARSCSFRSR